MTTLGVVQQVDVREFPMEIAKQMLALGKAFNMTLGVVSYNEAEIKLETLLQVLSDYREMFMGSSFAVDFKHSVIRFVSLHANNPNLMQNQARALLDFMNFFPTTESEWPYEKRLDYDERTGN